MRSPTLIQFVKVCVPILPAILTASCQTTASSGPNSLLFCQGAKPILWSAKDTAPTIGQAKEHNAVGKAACGWGSKNG